MSDGLAVEPARADGRVRLRSAPQNHRGHASLDPPQRLRHLAVAARLPVGGFPV
jgi:hypothetical protein